MFKNTSIKQRISIMIVFTICAQLLISGAIFTNTRSVEQHIGVIAEHSMRAIAPMTQVMQLQLEKTITVEQVRRATAPPSAGGRERSPGISQLYARYADLEDGLHAQLDQAINHLARATKTALNSEKAQDLGTLRTNVTELKKDFQAQHARNTALLEQLQSQNVIPGSQWRRYERETKALTDRTAQMVSLLEKNIESDLLAVKTETQEVLRSTVVISFIVIGLMVALGVATRQSISRGFERVQHVFENLSTGDFGQPIPQDESGEFGALCQHADKTRQSLSDIISTVTGSAHELNHLAKSLESGHRRISSDAATQSQDIDQASEAINALSMSANQVATHASETHSLNETIVSHTDQTQSVNAEVTQYILDFVQSMKLTADSVMALDENMDNVATVLDGIGNIAEQTNLLALNAAIEAARAGEQGRGFAVVADEVRTLAQRTQQSTAEIATMMKQFRTSTHEAISGMDLSRTWGEKMVVKAKESQALVEKVQTAVTSINEMTRQIANAAHEQSCTAEEINGTMDRINSSSTNTQSEIKAATALSMNVLGLAEQLSKSISQFKL